MSWWRNHLPGRAAEARRDCVLPQGRRAAVVARDLKAAEVSLQGVRPVHDFKDVNGAVVPATRRINCPNLGFPS